jgi:hypothetical protein
VRPSSNPSATEKQRKQKQTNKKPSGVKEINKMIKVVEDNGDGFPYIIE